jgi:hypothetical protein
MFYSISRIDKVYSQIAAISAVGTSRFLVAPQEPVAIGGQPTWPDLLSAGPDRD